MPEGKAWSATKKKKESIQVSPLGVRSPGRNGDGNEKHSGCRRWESGNKRRLTQELIESVSGEVSKYSEERMSPSEKQIEIGREIVEGDRTYVSDGSSYSSSTRNNGGDDHTADPQALKRVLESSAFIVGSTKDQSIYRDDDHTADPLALKRVLESSDFLVCDDRDNNETAGHAAVAAVLNSGDDILVNELAEDDNVGRPSHRRVTAGICDVQRLLGSISDVVGQEKEDMTCELLSIAKKDKNRRLTADSTDLNDILNALDEDEGSGRMDAVKSSTISQDTADMSGLQSAMAEPKLEDKGSGLSSSGGGSSNRRLTADISELNSVFTDIMEGEEERVEVVGAMKLSASISQISKCMPPAAVELRLEEQESWSGSSGGGSNRRLTADTSELKSVFADVMVGEEGAVDMKSTVAISHGITDMPAAVELRPEEQKSGSSSSGRDSNRRLTADLSELNSMFADVIESEEQDAESSDNDISKKWKKKLSSNDRGGDRRHTADMTEVKLVLAGLDEEVSKVTTKPFPLPSPPSPPRGHFESSQKDPPSIPVTTSVAESPMKTMVLQGTSVSSPPSVRNLLSSVDEAKEDEAMSNDALKESSCSPHPIPNGELQGEKYNSTRTQVRRDSLHFLTEHSSGAVSGDVLSSPGGLPIVAGTSSLKSCLSSKIRSRRSLPAPNMMDTKLTPRKKPFNVEQDTGSGKRVGFGTLSAVEFRSGSPSTKLTPMPTRDARAAFPLDGQNDLRSLRSDSGVEEEDEDTATNTMILDEWEEEAKAAESRRVAQVEAAAAKRGSPSPSSRRGTLMPPRPKTFNVQGLVKNLQQEESFCDPMSFSSSTDSTNGNDGEQQQSLPSRSSGSSVSTSTTPAIATFSPLPISMKVDCRGGDGSNDLAISSPVISVAITVKQSPQKVIVTSPSPLSRLMNINDESYCSDMDISDVVVSPVESNTPPRPPCTLTVEQKHRKGEKLTCLPPSTTLPSLLRDITNQVDSYEAEISFLSSDHGDMRVSDGEEDDRTQQLEPTLGGLLKGLEAEGAAGKYSYSAQTRKKLSDDIEEDRKESHTMELEPSLGGVLARLDQTENSPAVAAISRYDSSTTSFSIVSDTSHGGQSQSCVNHLEQTVEGLMLLTTPGIDNGKKYIDLGGEREENNVMLPSFDEGSVINVSNPNSNNAKHADGDEAGNEVSTCLSPSSVELKEGQEEGEDNDVSLTMDKAGTTSGRGPEIDKSHSPLALSVVMEEDESDLRHSTEFTENNSHDNNGGMAMLQQLSVDSIRVNEENSIGCNVDGKAQESSNNDNIISGSNGSLGDEDSKYMSNPVVPNPNPPPPLSFKSLVNFCMPKESTMAEVQSALLPVSSNIKESPSDKGGDMVRTLLHAVELHLLTYATEELIHQLVPEGVKEMADALLDNKADQPIVKRIESAAAGAPQEGDENLGEKIEVLSGQVKKNVMVSLFTSELRWIDMLSARTREVASEIDDKAHTLLRGKAYLELLDKQLDTIDTQLESERSKKEAEAKEAEAKAYANVMANIDASRAEMEELEEQVRQQEEARELRKRYDKAEGALTAIEKGAYQEEENVIDLENKISLIRGLHNWGNPLKLWSSEIIIPFVPYCSRQTVHALRATLSDSGNAVASMIPLTAPTTGSGPSGRRKRARTEKNMGVVALSTAAEMISRLVFDSNSGIFSPSGAAGSISSTVKCFSDIPSAVTAIERIQGRSNTLVWSVDWLVKKVGLLCRVEPCGNGEPGSDVILHVDLRGKGTLSFVVDAGCAILGFEPKLCVKEGSETDDAALHNAKHSATRGMASSGGGMALLLCVDSVCKAIGLPSIFT